MGWRSATLLWCFAATVCRFSSCTGGECAEFPEPTSSRVVQQPTNTYMIQTQGSSTRNVEEVQKVSLWNHQVLDIEIKGSKVTGGTFKLEFCDFDVKLPGIVTFAPLPGENSDRRLIVVMTDILNVTKAWTDFGVYAGYPIRVSTLENSNGNEDLETYRIYFSRCSSKDCNGVTVQLDREYTGPIIEGTRGSVWGCSWTLPDTRLPFNADTAQVKGVFESVLGANSVHKVQRTLTKPEDPDAGFRYRVFLAKGVNGVHTRVNSQGLRGEALQPGVNEVSKGARLGDVFQPSQWSGSFRLAHKGVPTAPISVLANGLSFAEQIRELPSIGPEVSVSRSSDGWSWMITFRNEIGDVAQLDVNSTDTNPVGGQLTVETPVPGEAMLEGQFELVSSTTGKSVLVPVSASEFNMRSLLRNELGLSDVSVRRIGPTPNNGYTWIVEFGELCPSINTFEASMKDTYYVPVCNISLSKGAQTDSLLLGNDATLTVSNVILVTFGDVDNQQVEWKPIGRLPQGLPAPILESEGEGLVRYLFPSDSGRGRFVFQAKKPDSDTVVFTHMVYVNASPPLADPGPSTPVSWPTDWIDLDASGSRGTFGSTIVAYQWTLLSKPAGAGAQSGTVLNPDSVHTVARNMDSPGEFVFGLTVVDSLGIRGCAERQVEVLFRPEIIHPLQDKVVIPGETVEYFCNATGSQPISYDWFFKDIELDNGGKPLLRLTYVTEQDQGNYTCTATNSVGRARNNVVTLNVIDAVEILEHPTSRFATPLSPSVMKCVAQGTFPIEATWQKLSSEGIWKNITSRVYTDIAEKQPTDFVFTVDSPEESDEGEYRCMLSNKAGTAVSKAGLFEVMDLPKGVRASVTPPHVLEEGVDVGSSFRLACEAEGVDLSFAWRHNGNHFANGASVLVSNVTGHSSGGDFICVVSNGAGSTESNTISIHINTPPVIVKQPVSIIRDPGEEGLLSVIASGAQPLEYLWMKDGQFIREERAAMQNLTFYNIQEEDSGLYRVVIHNSLGYVESIEVSVTVRDPPFVYFPEAPISVNKDPGESVTLTCKANGTEAMTFHWVERVSIHANYTRVVSGRERSGSDWSELQLFDLKEQDEREFACVATSRLGTAQSVPIKLDIADSPYIIQHPSDLFVEPGHSAKMQVVAGGAAPLQYQWRKDGIVIPNANMDYLLINNVQESDKGFYDCRVTNRLNPINGAVSRVATLRLAEAPNIITQPVEEIQVDPGTPISFTSEFGGAPPMTYQWLKLVGKSGPIVVLHEETVTTPAFRAQLNLNETVEEDEAEYMLKVWNRLGNATSREGRLIVNNPPRIVSELEKFTVDPGDSLTLSCVVDADPPVVGVTWLFQSELGGQGEVVIQGETGFSLELNSISQSNEGKYKCFASNSAGKDSKIVGEIEVRDPPTIVKMYPTNSGGILTLDPSQQLTLDADVVGLEPFVYEWSVNGEVRQHGATSSFVFNAQEEGFIKLRVSNPLGEDTGAIQVRLNERAKVTSFFANPESGRVIPESFAEFTCVATGTPPLRFEWKKDDVLINVTATLDGFLGLSRDQEEGTKEPFRVIQTSGGNSSVLQLFQAEYSTHDGNYTCTVSNSANPGGDTTEPKTFRVVQAPVIIPASPADMTNYPGRNLTFGCRLEQGTPPFQVQWFFTETLEATTPVLPLWNMSTPESRSTKYLDAYSQFAKEPIELSILNAEESDQGLYSCHVCNEAGCVQSRWANLGVYDSPRIIEQVPSPAAPNLTANPGDTVEFSVTAIGLEPLGFVWSSVPASNPQDSIPLNIDNSRVFLEPSNCFEANQPCKLIFSRVQPSDQGQYRCLVTNALGMTSSVAVSLTVNRPPTLRSQTEWPTNLITACPGNKFRHELQFDGALPMTVSWFFVSTFEETSDMFLREPFATSTLTNANQVAALSISDPKFANEGFYGFITSNMAGSLRSTVARLEVNEGPSAAADADGPSPRHPVTLPQTFTRLYGTASKNGVSYLWELVSSPPRDKNAFQVQLLSPKAASTDVIGLSIPGPYTFRLTVTGANGCISVDTVTVHVHSPPVPLAGDIVASLGSGQPIVLDGSASYDPDEAGSIVDYEWSILSFNGDESETGNATILSASSAKATLDTEQVGMYRISFTVTDIDGAQATRIVTVSVIDIAVLAPSLPLAAPFIVGNCFQHLLSVTIRGALAKGSAAWVQFSLVKDNANPVLLKEGTIGDFLGAPSPSSTSSSSSTFSTTSSTAIVDGWWNLVHQWKVEHSVEPGTWAIKVIVEHQDTATAHSVSFPIVLPYRFVVKEDWSDCNCTTSEQTRQVSCIGYGVDSKASSQSCAWVEVEHDESLCEKFSFRPIQVRTCHHKCTSPGRLWHVGPWSAGGAEWSKAQFCSMRACGATRERTVQCVDGSGSVVADKECASDTMPPKQETCSTSEERCLQLGWENSDLYFNASLPASSCRKVRGVNSVVSHCRDVETGFMFWPDSTTRQHKCGGRLLEIVGDGQELTECEYVWKIGEWVCDASRRRAVRDVECIASATEEVVSRQHCHEPSEPTSEGPCEVGSVAASDMKHHWRIGAWSNCPSIDQQDCEKSAFQTRNVLCMNKHGEIARDEHCEKKMRKPLSVQKCKSTCQEVSPCSADCGEHGACDRTTGTCRCEKGWIGVDCSVWSMTDCPLGSSVDSNGACCSAGVLLSARGECCFNEESVIDAEGECCNGELDACGVCNGPHRFVDVKGTCCAGVLDAGGECCESSVLDRCGVCNGTGQSCSVEVRLLGRLNSSLTRSPEDEEMLRDVFVKSLQANQTLSGFRLVQFESTSKNGEQGRRLESGENDTSVLDASFMAHFVFLPNENVTEHDSRIPTSWEQSGVLGVDSISAGSRGVCGNGICEVQERCLVPEGEVAGGEENAGCCPFDCLVSNPVTRCPDDCSGNGKCYTTDGQCDCFSGYTGASCNECAVDAKLVSGRCIPSDWIPRVGAVAIPTEPPTSSPSARVKETIQPTGSPTVVATQIVEETILWPGILIGLLLALLLTCCFSAVMYKKLKERQMTIRKYILGEKSGSSGSPQSPTSGRMVWPVQDSVASKGHKPQGWIWKKSRFGFEGKQVWQQWYAVHVSGKLHYFSSEEALYREESSGEETNMEKGCIDLRDVDHVALRGKKMSKDGAQTWWRFDLVMSPGKGVEEAVDVLDYPIIQRRGSVMKTSEVVEWMCESKHEMESWSAALAKFSRRGCVENKAGREDTESKAPAIQKRISITLKQNSSDDEGSLTSSVRAGQRGEDEDKESPVQEISNLVVGSFSGAVGYRVSCEGWVRAVEQKKNLYAVLFPDLDQFAVFEAMSPAKDGAHHFVGKVLEIELSKVSDVTCSKSSANKMELHYWVGKSPRVFRFVVSSKSRPEWEKCLQQHMYFRHGLDVRRKSIEGDASLLAGPTSTNASPGTEETKLRSPVSPELDENEPVNESLSSLKLRRVSSTASLSKLSSVKKETSAEIPWLPPKPPSVSSGVSSVSASASAKKSGPRSMPRRAHPLPKAPGMLQRTMSESSSSFHSALSGGAQNSQEHPLGGAVLPRRSSLSSVLDGTAVGRSRRGSAWSQDTDGSEYEVV